MKPPRAKVAGIVLALGLVGLFAALRLIEVYRRSSMEYSLRATYTSLPNDDVAIEGWLRGLPGVRSSEVVRDGSTLSLQFELSDPQPDDPLGLALNRAEALGYTGCRSYGGQFSRRRVHEFMTLRAEYDSLPANDGPLMDWLRANPTLIRSSVAREGNFLTIEFVMKDPPVPTTLGEILKACRSLGYGDEKGHLSGFGPYR